MSKKPKKHDALFDDVLSGLEGPARPVSRAAEGRGSDHWGPENRTPENRTPENRNKEDRAGARFLKRSTTINDRLSGALEEKTLRWVSPDRCRMWARHNRDYALLNEENCRDLIDGIRAQGRQEFPAIVRRIEDPEFDYEVICGARRHFAVSWLRANTYTQFKYLVEPRDLSDEEAFRLADIENRDREDISDYERAVDYADAVARYYSGKQKAMADRLEVSQPWLSRYLQLAKLPKGIVAAFPSVRDLRERHARDLKPLLADPVAMKAVLKEADHLAQIQQAAAQGRARFVDAPAVMRRLVKAGKPQESAPQVVPKTYATGRGDTGIQVRRKAKTTVIEFDNTLDRTALETALQAFLKEAF